MTHSRRSICPLSDSRDLVDQFIIRHLVLRIRRSVRAKKHAHDVVSVSFNQALLDQFPGEFTDIVQPRAESAVLACGQVPDIFKQWSWDVPPDLLEDEIVPRRVESGVDAINQRDISSYAQRKTFHTYNDLSFRTAKGFFLSSSEPNWKSKPALGDS